MSKRERNSMSLWKFEHRAVIKYLVKNGKYAKEINWPLIRSVYHIMVKRCTRLFKEGRESIKTEEYPEAS